ncbi:uncharacterized protein LOC134438646 [Engraulis encrasicolus]|uniref:uncharacterized protein LOC134438646 n=1 Tax=Engraulis encrasicolus TaxID=184585 RepID=UPI002FD69323
MPKSCAVPGCSTNAKKNLGLKFHRIPGENQRRLQWLRAIGRRDNGGQLWNPQSCHHYVCGLHFITSGPQRHNPDHPDFVPSVLPNREGDAKWQQERVDQAVARARRQRQLALSSGRAWTTEASVDTKTEALADAAQGVSAEAPQQTTSLSKKNTVMEQLCLELVKVKTERDEVTQQTDEAITQLKRHIGLFSTDSVRYNDAKCQLLTGVSWKVFEILHDFLSPRIAPKPKFKLSTEDELFISLVKLRQNPSTDLLCTVMNLPHITFLDIFSRWLILIYANIGSLVSLPDREGIRTTVPAQVLLQYPRLTSITDCFEIRIEHSKQRECRAATYSTYKSWTTVKYFIAYHPSGTIIYLSKGWAGSTSDARCVWSSGFISPIVAMLLC